MIKLYKLFFLLVFLGFSCTSTLQVERESVNDNPALDSSIRSGRLQNGLTYFIKSLSEPQTKLYMRFYHKAGSNEEDPDQFDVAHGVEHLAFKATKNFPKGVRQSESIKKLGISIYDMLAYSGQTTEYYFDAPPDNQEALETAFLFFKDILTGLSLTDDNINSVKGELRQEFQMGASDNLNEESASKKLEASFFPCRQEEPNFVENLSAQDPEVFRRFYRDWYRPDLFALSIVGNIEDIDSLERQIKITFSNLKLEDNPKKLENCDSLFANRPPQFYVIERTPAGSKLLPDTKVNIEIIFRDPTTMSNLDNFKGIKRLILFQLLRGIANERFKETTSEYPYGSFSVGFRDRYKSDQLPSSLNISATIDKSVQERQAFQHIFHVLQQLQRYGVSEAEWDAIKETQLQYIEAGDIKNAAYWINEIKSFYTRGESLPSNKNSALKNWLSNLTISEFNDFLGQFLSKKPEDIGIIAPSGHQALLLSENEVRSWIEETYQKEIEPYEKAVIPVALMTSLEIEKLEKPEIVNNNTSTMGGQEFILNNGLRLIIKPSKASPGWDQDQIRIHGYSLKGAQCFPQEHFYSAVNASNIISFSGVNGMNKFELSRFLEKNKMLSGVVSSYIGINESGMQGSSSLENFEFVLQLMYLHFTKANKNKEGFEDWKLMKYKTYKYQSNLEFGNAIRKITGDLSVVRNVFGKKSLAEGEEFLKGVEKTNLDQAYGIYRKIFSNAEDFTFVITGDFKIETILPLAAKYLGNLPNSSSPFTCSDDSNTENILLSKGPKYIEIKPSADYTSNYLKYNITFLQAASTPLDWREQLEVEALGWITTQKAWRLRFEMGLELYDIRVWTAFNNNLNRYKFSSIFECVPEEYPIIRAEIQNIISEIKSGQITNELFQQGMYAMHFYYDIDKRGGRHLEQHQNLYEHYRYGQPWVDPIEVEEFVNSLTIDDVVEAANKYYKDENMFEFVMKDKNLEKEF